MVVHRAKINLFSTSTSTSTSNSKSTISSSQSVHCFCCGRYGSCLRLNKCVPKWISKWMPHFQWFAYRVVLSTAILTLIVLLRDTSAPSKPNVGKEWLNEPANVGHVLSTCTFGIKSGKWSDLFLNISLYCLYCLYCLCCLCCLYCFCCLCTIRYQSYIFCKNSLTSFIPSPIINTRRENRKSRTSCSLHQALLPFRSNSNCRWWQLSFKTLSVFSRRGVDYSTSTRCRAGSWT